MIFIWRHSLRFSAEKGCKGCFIVLSSLIGVLFFWFLSSFNLFLFFITLKLADFFLINWNFSVKWWFNLLKFWVQLSIKISKRLIQNILSLISKFFLNFSNLFHITRNSLNSFLHQLNLLFSISKEMRFMFFIFAMLLYQCWEQASV